MHVNQTCSDELDKRRTKTQMKCQVGMLLLLEFNLKLVI